MTFSIYSASIPVFKQILGSLPSQLLERRPDIASAERSVIAANAKIGELTLANDFLAGALGKAGLLSTSRCFRWYTVCCNRYQWARCRV